MNIKKFLKYIAIIPLCIILFYFATITFFKNYREDSSLPSPQIVLNGDYISSKNCDVAVYTPNGFGNFYFGSFLKTIGDGPIQFTENNKTVYEFFCSKKIDGNTIYSNKYIEYNSITKSQTEKSQTLLRKLFY